MSGNNQNSEQLNELLKTLSKRLGKNPEQIKSAAQSGNINSIIKGLSKSDSEKIQKAMSDKNIASKILASPQAQKLLKKLTTEEK